MRASRMTTVVVLIALGAVAASQALAASVKHQKVVSVGIVLSRSGNSAVSLYKLHSSLYGNGAAVQKAKLKNSTFPLHGTDTITTYYTDGAASAADKFTIGPLDAAGIAKITGTGKCTGGTGIHKHQHCSYKLSGTYNSKTSVSHVTAIGTVSG